VLDEVTARRTLTCVVLMTYNGCSWYRPCLEHSQGFQAICFGALEEDKQLLLKRLLGVGFVAALGCAGSAVKLSAACQPQQIGQAKEAAKPNPPEKPLQSSEDKKDKTKDEKAAGADSQPSSGSGIPAGVDLKNYRIGIEDELMISVWREPELSNQVVVRPDGKITLPLVNEIQVVGLRTDELQAILTEKLKPYVNTPQVTVIVRGIRSLKVSLVGNVGHQGTFSLNGEKTILELLAEAGGLGPFAKTGAIYILRESEGKKVRIGFDYKKAISGKGPNPELHPGDLIVVP
jgi:polysaccharide biosynthesis/export protein